MKSNVLNFALFFCAMSLLNTGCGRERDRLDQRRQGNDDLAVTIDPLDPYTVRATWQFALDTSPALSFSLLGSANVNIPIAATVQADVRFDVDADALFAPENPDGVASLGTLVISELRDNTLSVCGSSQDERCTVAAIRIYTTGVAGAGMWNAAEGYGVPISTDDNEIGLDTAGSHVVASVALGNRRVVRLNHFNGGQGVSIPITADFTEAGAGSFATTLVVEYIAQ